MTFRKFNADQLFTGYAMLSKSAVLITDEKGVLKDIVPYADAGDGVEHFNGIITPGFINCHCHLELSHLHELIPRGSGMIKFLLSVIGQREAVDEKINAAMASAVAYMHQHGIVAVGDVCNTADSLQVKKDGKLYYHNFVESFGFTDSQAVARFHLALQLYSLFKDSENGRSAGNVSIVPHSPYSVSDTLFKLINNHEKGSLLSIHNQESTAEAEFFATGKGEMLELFAALGIESNEFIPSNQSSLIRSIIKLTADHSVILVHNVNTKADDLETLRRGRNVPELYWCMCPNANLYINDALPDVQLFKNFNCKIVVGTDSLASNSGLDILEELKTMQVNFPGLTTGELLKWATINGAEALRIDNKYGSFEKDKQPGIVQIDGVTGATLEGSVAKRIL
jgi:aminodeoxyfutalosine deaminase